MPAASLERTPLYHTSAGRVAKPLPFKRMLRCPKTSSAFSLRQRGHTENWDILVNNAGIYEFAPLDAVTPEHIHKHFNLNVAGLLLTTKEAVKLIGSESGSIVNIRCIVGPMPAPHASTYSASKAAVDAISMSLASELGPSRIRVNSLNPGMVDTDGLRTSGIAQSDFRKLQDKETPLGRIAQPEDIALAAVFLASEDARWITGQVIIAAGGRRM
jgi:3-oxoacyl-[acyl-carrier protein] reductase